MKNEKRKMKNFFTADTKQKTPAFNNQMKRGQLIFAAIFSVMVVLAMGSLAVYAACDDTGTGGVLFPLSKAIIKVFSFPLGISATQLLKVSGYMLLFYLADVFVYSWVLAFFVDKWMGRRL